MKKRRELDAMASRMKPIKNGNHELLRNVSFSSENEELLQTDRDNMSNCYVLSMLFHFVIIIIAIASVGGLIWMQLQLKEQVRDLKMEMATYSTEVMNAQNKIKEIETHSTEMTTEVKNIKTNLGDLQITSVIDNINHKIDLLNSSQFKDITNQLSKSVALLSSRIKDLEEQVSKALTEQKSMLNQSQLEHYVKNITHNITQLHYSMLTLKLFQNQKSLEKANDNTLKLNKKLSLLEEKLDKNLKENNKDSNISPVIGNETKSKQRSFLKPIFVSSSLKKEATTASNNEALNKILTNNINTKTPEKVISKETDGAEVNNLTTS